MWYVIGMTQCYTCWCAIEVWHNIVLHGIQYYITQYTVLHSVVCYCIMQWVVPYYTMDYTMVLCSVICHDSTQCDVSWNYTA